jgi:hypothetical protein
MPIAAAIALVVACSRDNDKPLDEAAALPGVDSGGFDPGDFGPDGVPASITIAPDPAKLEVGNGDLTAPSASVVFGATATYADGTSKPFGACGWSIDRIDLGGFTGATFRASGSSGGVGTVKCTAGPLTATAKIEVLLREDRDLDSGLDDTAKNDLVAAVTADPQLEELLYPYDATVFPRGLDAPELMWAGPAASDVYALRLEEPGIVYTSYFKASSPARASIRRRSGRNSSIPRPRPRRSRPCSTGSQVVRVALP